MPSWLKQSTSVVVQFGPFLDKTDGVTLETGLATALDNATTGIRISKNGAVFADRNSSTAPSYDAMGCYRITLDTTDTNTLGTLRMIFEEAATCLPVWRDFMIVPAVMWNSLFNTTGGNLPNVAHSTTGGVPVIGTGTNTFKSNASANVTFANTSIATVTNLTNLPAITSNWLTAAGINASALNGKGDWNIGKTGYSLTATTGLGNQTSNITGNLSGSVGSVTGAVGSVTGAVGSVTGHTAQTGDTFALANGATGFTAIDTVVDGIQTDLSNATDGLGAIKASVDAIPTTAMRGTDNAALATDLTTVDTVVDGIQTDLSNATDGLGALKTLIDAVQTAVDLIPTTAMRGTDSAATATALATAQTAIDAIKTATDQFVFTIANQVDANTKSINDATVVGDGNATPWDGA
jgi:hypothetical protein